MHGPHSVHAIPAQQSLAIDPQQFAQSMGVAAVGLDWRPAQRLDHQQHVTTFIPGHRLLRDNASRPCSRLLFPFTSVSVYWKPLGWKRFASSTALGSTFSNSAKCDLASACGHIIR